MGRGDIVAGTVSLELEGDLDMTWALPAGF